MIISDEHQHKSRSIPENVCNRAIDLMFPNLPVKSEGRYRLMQYIIEKFAALDCCVLYRVSTDFQALCQELHLDPGDQEVVILRNYTITYSKSFDVRPVAI